VTVSCFFFSVQVVLQLRIYALYGRSRNIAISMVTAFILEIITVTILLVMASVELTAMPEAVYETLTWCKPMDLPPWLIYFGVAVLIFETILSLLALFKTYQRVREVGSFPFTPTDLLDLLLRDSNLYYVGILTVYSVNVSLWSNHMEIHLDLAAGFTVAIPAVLASRIMLNVRLAHYGSRMLSVLSPSDVSIDMPEFNGHESIELSIR